MSNINAGVNPSDSLGQFSVDIELNYDVTATMGFEIRGNPRTYGYATQVYNGN